MEREKEKYFTEVLLLHARSSSVKGDRGPDSHLV